MEFRKLEVTYGGQKYSIEEDLPEVGAFLYVYDEKISKYDWLQNDIEMCKQVAFERYGIPLDSWIEVRDNRIDE